MHEIAIYQNLHNVKKNIKKYTSETIHQRSLCDILNVILEIHYMNCGVSNGPNHVQIQFV